MVGYLGFEINRLFQNGRIGISNLSFVNWHGVIHDNTNKGDVFRLIVDMRVPTYYVVGN